MSGSPETLLQMDMFSEELVDTRTRTQKKRDRERTKPQQAEMFPARELAQFGVNPRPLIELSPHTKLTLWREDPRTEEEIERDRQRAIEEQTHQMFNQNPELYNPVAEESSLSLALMSRPVVALVVYGYLEAALHPFEITSTEYGANRE